MTKQFMGYFDIRPKVKGRPRFTKTGHTYTPKTTVDYEKVVAGMFRGNPNSTYFTEDEFLSVTIIVEKDGFELTIKELPAEDGWAPTKLRGDIDNYSKSILDALNKVAWNDDRQIRVLHIELL